MTDSEPVEDWETRLRGNRAEKDRFFAEHRQSPIPPEEREAFDGLSYFDPAPEYRVEASVGVYENPEPVEMDTSDGRTVGYRRVASFTFELGGGIRTLYGYRREGEDTDGVFVPFRDKTTGQETYQGGRYIELEPDRPLAEGDRVTIDFNLAYAPFCAYSETFACPLPPEENWLELAVEAGERTR
jgi:uncharacterized protein (DUF1684 family)